MIEGRTEQGFYFAMSFGEREPEDIERVSMAVRLRLASEMTLALNHLLVVEPAGEC